MKAPPRTLTEMPALLSFASLCELVGRVLLCLLFLITALMKIGTYEEMVNYMSSHGVPAVLLPAVIATETLGALAVALGWKTRIIAFLLAVTHRSPRYYFITISPIQFKCSCF